MHIPDHYLDATVSLAAGALACGALAFAARKAGGGGGAWKAGGGGGAWKAGGGGGAWKAGGGRAAWEGGVCTRPGGRSVVPAFVACTALLFSAQMVNYPVAGGTSGHLLGAALAVVLLGPWFGMLSLATVLVVQALLFADGGLGALGLNVLNIAVVGCLGAWAIRSSLTGRLAGGRLELLVATALASVGSVLLAAAAFCVEYLLGGTAPAATGSVLWRMLSVHGLIGVGEALITTVALGVVVAFNPGVVFAQFGGVSAAADR